MKAKILLLITLVTFLTACESNDDPNFSLTEADLIGTWSLKSQTLEEGTITVSSQGDSFSANYSAVAEDIDFTYTFSNAPNELELQGEYNFITSVEFFGQTETEEQEINTDFFPVPTASWSLNENSITITENYSTFPAILNVVEFSANYIKLEGKIEETESEDGDRISIEGTMFIELVK
jgi:hypothetical protein